MRPEPRIRFGADTLGLDRPIQAIAVAPHQPVVSALAHETLAAWNLLTGERLSHRPAYGCRGLAFSDDASLVTFQKNDPLRLPLADDARVPLAIAGLEHADTVWSPVMRPDRSLAVLKQQQEGDRPTLWRLDLRAGSAVPLVLRLTPGELAMLGIPLAKRDSIEVRAAALGDDGSTLALVELAGTPSVWAYVRWTPGGDRLTPLPAGHHAGGDLPEDRFDERRLLLHPSGRWAANLLGTPALVDLASGNVVRSFALPAGLEGAPEAGAFCDRGRTLLAVTARGIVEWEVETGAVRAKRRFDQPASIGGFAVGERAGLVAVADGTAVLAWSLPALEPLRPSAGHRDAITALALAPRGRHIASGDARALKLWHVPSGELVWTRDVAPLGLPLAFAPDGERLAVIAKRRFTVLETATGEVLAKADRRSGGAAVWCDDGRLVHLDITEGERGGDFLELYEGPERREVFRTRTFHLRCDPALSADGRRAVVYDEHRAHGWDLTARRRLWSRDLVLFRVALAPDGERALASTVGPHPLAVLDVSNGGRLAALPGGAALATALAWGARDRVAVGDGDGSIALFQVPREGPAPAAPWRRLDAAHRAAVTALAFSPDGSQLVSGASDGSVALWTLD